MPLVSRADSFGMAILRAGKAGYRAVELVVGCIAVLIVSGCTGGGNAEHKQEASPSFHIRVGQSNVASVRADDGSLSQLTNNGAGWGTPGVNQSDAGDRIAFAAFTGEWRADDARTDVLVAAHDGKQPEVVASVPFFALHSRVFWADDDKKLVFASEGDEPGAGDSIVNIVDLDEGSTAIAAKGRRIELLGVTDNHFVIRREDQRQGWIFETVDLGSFETVRSFIPTFEIESLDATAGLSQVAATDSDTTDSLYIMDLLEEPPSVRTIELDDGYRYRDRDVGDPAVSPDGRFLIYHSGSPGWRQIWLVDLEATPGPIRLGEELFQVGSTAWLADSSGVAATVYQGSSFASPSVHVIGLDGTVTDLDIEAEVVRTHLVE